MKLVVRPLSVSVIAWIIIILSVVGIVWYSAMKQQIIEHMELMNTPVHLYYLGLVTSIINFICSLGMLRGINAGRLLYLAWGVIMYIYSLVILKDAYIWPVVGSIVVFVIFNIFLFSRSANEYFGQGKTP
jgi:hypothetical protein